jgi:hypothetical protein
MLFVKYQKNERLKDQMFELMSKCNLDETLEKVFTMTLELSTEFERLNLNSKYNFV